VPLMEEVRLLAVQATARATSAAGGSVDREESFRQAGDQAKLFR
jgi:hypothetical protein